MGGEWRGGKEEGSGKKTFLCRVEAQETHCSWRHEGFQVKIDTPQTVKSLMTTDHPSSHCTAKIENPQVPDRLRQQHSAENF